MAALTPQPESLAQLLRSNEAPSHSQKILVEEILREREAEKSVLGAEISRLESTLQALRSKQADLDSEMNLYSSVLSPIRRLPPEIVGEIFLYFTPSMQYELDLGLQEPQAVNTLPWKLGHVCCLWRMISLSLTQLWSVVDLWSPSRFYDYDYGEYTARSVLGEGPDDIERAFTELPVPTQYEDDFENADGYEIETSLDYIQGCLPRSGNHPLSLRLSMRNSAVCPLLDTLLKHSARWREIVLINAQPMLLERLTQFKGDLQGLRRIVFTGYCDSAPDFQSAPNLTDLAFLHVRLPFRNHLGLPWSRLTRYSEIDAFWRQWPWDTANQQRLASYQQLTNLLVLCMDSSSDFPPTSAPIILPSLRVASFRFSRTTANAIRSFEMPALEELSIEYSNDDHADFDRLRAQVYFPRSSSGLKILRVRAQIPYLPLGQGDLERAFEIFPDLTEIMIDVHNLISNTDISRLVPYHGQLPLAPKLEIIRVSNRSFIHNICEWQTLLDMLRARFQPTVKGISRLRTFEFSTEDSANDGNVTAGLQTLSKRNRWNIRVGDECQFPAWDKLALQTA